jgi:hypothetical protein
MKENFRHWPSGDELIQYTQLNASQVCDYLEFIPFEKFELINRLIYPNEIGVHRLPFW